MSREQTLEDLIAARSRIASFETWCQNDEAFSKEGRAVPPHAKTARRWCSIGSVRAISPGASRPHRVSEAERHLEAASQALYGISVARVNDGKRAIGELVIMSPQACHAAVLMIFDLAIEGLAPAGVAA